MAVDPTTALPAGRHLVRFVDGDLDLAQVVVAHLAEGLDQGERGIVVATPDHCRLFRAGLGRAGQRDIRFLDAAATLAALLVDGRPDAARFDEVVGAAVRDAATGVAGVRAFGEMVVLLWEDGNVAGALELEHLWNDVCAVEPVCLLCAYPWRVVADGDVFDDFTAVCHAHDEVVGAAPSTADADVALRLPKSPDAARHARRFVADVLHAWGVDHIVDAAALVVTELTTNALRHAGSDVIVSLRRAGDVVRVAVADASSLPPRPRQAMPDDLGGRGLRLVGASAAQWGHRHVDGGKLVWADLPLTTDP